MQGGKMTADEADEGDVDPWVSDWIAANPLLATPFDDLSPENLQLARSPVGPPPTRQIAEVVDRTVEGIPVRIYRQDGPHTGLVVYFHGGGFVMGSVGLMDNVARELTHSSNAVVVSVDYRLAPEHPYPGGLDDCETVVRWALAHTERFGVPPGAVAVAGESAGGNLSAAVALRLRDSTRATNATLAAQVLIYPALAGSQVFQSTQTFDGLIINRTAKDRFWAAYSAGRDLDADPYAAPLHAPSLTGLPPAFIALAGCDMLRDEGRAYANRLREDGVDVDVVSYPGQPHGFINFAFPAAGPAYARVGAWLRTHLARAS
jgi:acetyl esterase